MQIKANFECFLVHWQYYGERDRDQDKKVETDRQANTQKDILKKTETGLPQTGERWERPKDRQVRRRTHETGIGQRQKKGVLKKKIDSHKSIEVWK